MTDKQHPALFDWATELSDAQGHVTLSEQEAHEIGARLRRLHARIAELQARIKTMAEEHADELMVAHMDGRMRAAQPAGEYPAPTDAEIDALWVGQQLTVPQLVQRRVIARAAQDGGDVAMTTTQVEHAQPEALRGAPPSAYSQEDRAFYTFWYGHMLNDLMQPPLAGVSHATARYIWDAAIAHAAAPAQAADSVLEDAARLDWLDKNIFHRDMYEWDARYGHGDGYNMWVLFAPKGAQGSARSIIDAARAAQEGKSHG